MGVPSAVVYCTQRFSQKNSRFSGDGRDAVLRLDFSGLIYPLRFYVGG